MRHEDGFTLIEIMVAIALTSIAIVSLLTVFSTFIRKQVVSQNERIALNAIRFLMADIAREIYFGNEYTCGDGTDQACTCLVLTDQSHRRIKIRRSGTIVEKKIQAIDPNPDQCAVVRTGDWVPLTDTAVTIRDLTFTLDGGNEPSQVKIALEARYIAGGKTKDVSFQSQVTRRLFDPDTNILGSLVLGGGSTDEGTLSHFIFDDAGDCVDETGTAVQANSCDNANRPIAVEAIDDGLYVLTDNGLIFYISLTALTTALSATGTNTGLETFVPISSIAAGVRRVVGEGTGTNPTCRACANDPVNIESMHSSGRHLYARSRTGSLYKIRNGVSEILINSASGADRVRFVAGANGRLFVLYQAGGVRQMRLFSTSNVTGAQLTSGSCPEFEYVGAKNCSQLSPDPDTSNTTDVDPAMLLSIPLSFVDRLQFEGDGNFAAIWYRGDGPRALIIGSSATNTAERSDEVASGGDIVQAGFTGNEMVFICGQGGKLCSISDVNDKTVTSVTAPENILAISKVTSRVIGITVRGRIIYFDGGFSESPQPVTVYSISAEPYRIFCNIIPSRDGSFNQQVSFSQMSKASPGTLDMVALVGSARFQDGSLTNEIYLITERAGGLPYRDPDSLLCGAKNVERLQLPTPSFPVGNNNRNDLDIFRLTGLEFIDAAPSL